MGHTPYGYSIENGCAAINKDEADKIRKLYENYLSGMALAKAASAAGIDHWQRKFRQQAYGQMKASTPMNLSEVTVPAEAETTDISFVDLPCCPAAEKDAQMDATAAVIRTSAFTIEITNRISDALLHRILQEAAHA